MEDSLSKISDIDFWLKWQTWPDARHLIERYGSEPYIHPYGFVVVRLQIPYLTGWQARVHFWSSPRDDTSELAIHCHGAWQLRSRVLVGSVTESEFEFTPSPDGNYREFSILKTRGNTRSGISATGNRAFLRSTRTTNRDARSDVIAIPGDRFHSTLPSNDGIAVTLALTEESDYSRPSLIMADVNRAALTFDNNPIADISKYTSAADKAYVEEVGPSDEWASFAFVVRNDKILMTRTRRNPDHWVPIGGRAIADDTSPIKTVLRELVEETQIHTDIDALIYLGEEIRDIGDGSIHFWLLKLPSDQQVNINADKFRETSWVAIQDCYSLDLFQGTIAMLSRLERVNSA